MLRGNHVAQTLREFDRHGGSSTPMNITFLKRLHDLVKKKVEEKKKIILDARQVSFICININVKTFSA